MKQCKVIKHTISIEYQCPETKTKHSIKINSPLIYEGQYFEDWQYRYIQFKCLHCGKNINLKFRRR
jgi:cytochrome c biogenesis protein ResB